MGVVYGQRNYGLYTNGDLEYGNTYNFSGSSIGVAGNTAIYSSDKYRGNYCLKVSTG